jgi:hypothetical protein
MTWEAIAAIAELLGAAGVIASLVYLAGQVRSSGYQSRQASIQSVVNKMNEVWNTMAAASTADLWTRGSKGLENLNGESEGVQFSALMLSIFRPYEELFHYRTDGQVDDWTWESISSVCHALMATPGFADWWERRSSWFSADFRAHIAEVQGSLPEYRRFGDEGAARAS